MRPLAKQQKLTFKSLKSKPKPLSEFTEQLWKSLSNATGAILAATAGSESYEQLFRACETLCNTPEFAPVLYARIDAILREECNRFVAQISESFGTNQSKRSDNSALTLLATVSVHWRSLVDRVSLVSLVFLPLERGWTLRQNKPNLDAIVRGSLHALFLDPALISLKGNILLMIVQSILECIALSRRHENPRQDVKQTGAPIRNAISFLWSIDLFEIALQRPFLDNSLDHYTADASELIATSLPVGGLPTYMRAVEEKLQSEVSILCDYFAFDHATTKSALLRQFWARYVANYATRLVEHTSTLGLMDLSAFNGSDAEKCISCLRRLYGFMEEVNLLPVLQQQYAKYLRERGSQLLQECDFASPEFVPLLLGFKAKTDRCVTDAFQNSELFQKAMRESWGHFINTRAQNVAESIAKYVDLMLRGQLKPQSNNNDAQVSDDYEGIMDRILVIFRFIRGKDVFEEFYKMQLSKRLLLNKSSSIDAEKLMLQKLKSECGPGFTSRLEGMFKDMDIGADLMKNFRRSAFHEACETELSVNVLTAGFWPSYPAQQEEWALPQSLRDAERAYVDFYSAKHSGRNLQWQNQLAHCVLKAKFRKGNKELQVSMAQALVLLCFVDASRLSFGQLQERTRIEAKELQRTLQSLALGKTRVLLKSSKGKDIDTANDNFMINDEFEHKLFRVKINTIQIKETVEENTQTMENVFQNRIMAVDATIVRIMKARKTLKAQQLMQELFAQLKFPANATDLKTRIDHLIELEYLERDKDDRALYHYVA